MRWLLESGLRNIANTIAFTTNNQYNNGLSYTSDENGILWGTFDGSTINLYMDGVFKTSYSDSALASNSGTLAIGSCANLLNCGQYFPGTIDDVRIYNRALGADEIRQLYNAGR